MAHQFLSAKIMKPPPLLQNLYQTGIFIHTFFSSIRLTLHISDFKIRMPNRRHAYTILFYKNTCKTPKKEVFSYSRYPPQSPDSKDKMLLIFFSVTIISTQYSYLVYNSDFLIKQAIILKYSKRSNK